MGVGVSSQVGFLLSPDIPQNVGSLPSPLWRASFVCQAVCDGVDTPSCHAPLAPSSPGHSRKLVGLGRLRTKSGTTTYQMFDVGQETYYFSEPQLLHQESEDNTYI